MKTRPCALLLALFLAAGCSRPGTGTEIAAACQADLDISRAISDGVDSPKFDAAIHTLVTDPPEEIGREVQIVAAALRTAGPAGAEGLNNDEAYSAARRDVDGYFFEHCEGPKQSILALDTGYESLSIASPAGAVRFRLSNGGKDNHQMVIFARPPGSTGSFDELLNGLAAPETPTDEARELKSVASTSAQPGASAFTVAELAPGEYLVACLVRQGTRGDQVGTGAAYYEKGMKQQFTVG